ncbi:MAG: aminodeoxychorismate lyase [Gordonia sp. (in: high G+C Gram-positive bacteria)]|uniref:aminodeoxychorismate lyase n=1 Tax=Gordonia sp. (in: high G+C Gram-positive bacteria) TaxID=84139 RepID=UPI0039E2D45A
MATPILFDLRRGRLDPQQPVVTADDLSVVRGDGIFETLLVRHGRVCNLDRHLERFGAGAARMELPTPVSADWAAAAHAAAATWSAENDDAEGLLRLVYTRGRESAPATDDAPERATALVMVGPVGPAAARARADGVSACLLDRGYPSDFAATAPWQLIGVKTLSYATNMAALRHAAANGFDDVVYTSSDGMVLEGPRSSVVTVTGRSLRTPPADVGILPGTTVAAIFARAQSEGWDVDYTPLTPDDLRGADSVWLCSSVTVAARIVRLDDVELRRDRDDAVAARFADLASRAVVLA